jgi:hypothetical protein
VFEFKVTGGEKAEIDLVADPERLRDLDLTMLEG